MIKENQINNLKKGDKLIFIEYGGVLSAKKGNVFTFSNWWKDDDPWRPGKHYWQCEELHNMGNHEHGFSIYHTELFAENIHKDYVLMDEAKLISNQKEFIRKFGDE